MAALRNTWFVKAPKELRGSLLRAKVGKDFLMRGGSGAKFAMVRTHQGVVEEGGQHKLRVSVSGSLAGSRLLSRAELADLCEESVVAGRCAGRQCQRCGAGGHERG